MRATTYFRALLRAHDNLLHSQGMFIGGYALFFRDDLPSFKRLARQQEKFARRVMADLKAKDEYKAALPVLCDALLSVIELELAQNRLMATAKRD